MPALTRPRFYTAIALVTAALTVAGFSRTYFFRPLFDRPPLELLGHLHALSFTAWLVLFFVQVRLVAVHRVALHMKLGVLGIFVAAAMVASTVAVAIQHGRSGRVFAGIDPFTLMAGSLTSVALFAVFVGAALALRRRPEWHRRFMVLATISTIGPAVGRLGLMFFGDPHTIRYVVFFALFAACFAFDWRRYRIVHPAYLIGIALSVISWPGREALAKTEAWQQIARWMTG
jgi:hypothetical protein